jgi:hypothetical protein
MPSLDDALQRFLAERVGAAEAATDVAEHAELRSAQRTAGA